MLLLLNIYQTQGSIMHAVGWKKTDKTKCEQNLKQ